MISMGKEREASARATEEAVPAAVIVALPTSSLLAGARGMEQPLGEVPSFELLRTPRADDVCGLKLSIQDDREPLNSERHACCGRALCGSSSTNPPRFPSNKTARTHPIPGPLLR